MTKNGDATNPTSAWTCHKPWPLATRIVAGHVAFWGELRVEAAT